MELLNIKHSQLENAETISMNVKENKQIIANVEVTMEDLFSNNNQTNYLTPDGLGSLTRMTTYPYIHSIIIEKHSDGMTVSDISKMLYPLIGIIPAYTKVSDDNENRYVANAIVDYNIVSKIKEVLAANNITIEEQSKVEEHRHRM